MSTEELYADLPDDPELAFLQLEKNFREVCEEEAKAARNDPSVRDLSYTTYIGKVLAALNELGLTTSALASQEIPNIKDVSIHTYREFTKDVEHFKTQLQIRHSRRSKGYSVKLDSTAKAKIRHFLDQIKEIVDKLEVDQKKKDALYNKINALQAEVDRDRTRFDAYADLVIETAGTADEAAGKLNNNVRRLLDSIGKVIWGAKQEETPKLPPPTTPKKLEGPKSKLADDEIPF